MPRGVWDRSKSKEQRESEKGDGKVAKGPRGTKAKMTASAATKKIAAPTKKYGRQATKHQNTTHLPEVAIGGARINTLQTALTSFVQARAQLSNPGVIGKVESAISNTVVKIEKELELLFKENEESIETHEEVKVELRSRNGSAQPQAHSAPIAAPVSAPVPFNPPAPVQG